MFFSRQHLIPAVAVAFGIVSLSLGALQAADKPKLPEGTGKATTVKLCGVCHAAEIVMNRRESVDGWNAVVVDMIERGAKGTDDEFGQVVEYLVANFSKTAPVVKINVNQA